MLSGEDSPASSRKLDKHIRDTPRRPRYRLVYLGGMARRSSVTPEHCIPIPDAMSFDEASAFIMTYGTSHYALKNRGHLKIG